MLTETKLVDLKSVTLLSETICSCSVLKGKEKKPGHTSLCSLVGGSGALGYWRITGLPSRILKEISVELKETRGSINI